MSPPPIVPDYAGANVRGIVPALLGPATWARHAARLDAADGRRGPSRSVLLVLDGLGLGAAPGPRATCCRRWRRWHGGPITTVAPTTTATALTSIATGLTPGEHGLIGYRMVARRRDPQRPALGGQRRRPPARLPARRRPAVPGLPRSGRCRSSARSSWRNGVHRGPPARFGAGRLAGRVVAAGRGRAPAREPASASSTPTTAASTRSPTSAASATTTRPSCAPPTGSSATCSRRCPPARRCWSPPTTVRSTSATASCTPSASCWRMCALQSGEGRFRWLHARRGGSRRPAGGGRRPSRATLAWVVTREQMIDEDWFGPTVAAAGRAAPRRRRRRRPRAGQLLRSRRLGPVRAGVPPRLADVGRDLRSAAGGACGS